MLLQNGIWRAITKSPSTAIGQTQTQTQTQVTVTLQSSVKS